MIGCRFDVEFTDLVHDWNANRIQRGSVRNFGEFYDPGVTGMDPEVYDNGQHFETVQTIRASGQLYLRDLPIQRMHQIYMEVRRHTLDNQDADLPQAAPEPGRPDLRGLPLRDYHCEAFLEFYEDLMRRENGHAVEPSRPVHEGEPPLWDDSWFYAVVAPPTRRGLLSMASSSAFTRAASTRINPMFGAASTAAESTSTAHDFAMIDLIIPDEI